MSRTQPEARIVKSILDALNAMPHTHARKTHGSRYSVGWPDIVGAHYGQMFVLEVKQPGKKATARQAHELRQWEAAGALAGVVHCVDDALAVLAGCKLAAKRENPMVFVRMDADRGECPGASAVSFVAMLRKAEREADAFDAEMDRTARLIREQADAQG